MNVPLLIVQNANPCDADEWLCNKVYDAGGDDWLAIAVNWLVAKPLAILGLIAAGLIVRWLAHRVINRLVKGAGRVGSVRNARNAARAETLAGVLLSVVSVIVFGLVTIMSIGELGYNVGPLIAGAGIVGVALGLGAQGVVKDFLYGMFMFFEDQFGVGDTVTFDDVTGREVTGTVESLTLRTTKLRSDDGAVWYIRNGDVVKTGNRSQT